MEENTLLTTLDYIPCFVSVSVSVKGGSEGYSVDVCDGRPICIGVWGHLQCVT